MECISKSRVNYLVNVSGASPTTVPIGLKASGWLQFLDCPPAVLDIPDGVCKSPLES